MAITSHPARKAIEDSILGGGTSQEIADRIMGTLEDMKLIAYSAEAKPSLLTVNGRVLMLIMEYPETSLREIAARIGSTESAASRSIKNLIDAKLIRRQKVRGKNKYVINVDVLLAHSDLRRFYLAADTFLSSVLSNDKTP